MTLAHVPTCTCRGAGVGEAGLGGGEVGGGGGEAAGQRAGGRVGAGAGRGSGVREAALDRAQVRGQGGHRAQLGRDGGGGAATGTGNQLYIGHLHLHRSTFYIISIIYYEQIYFIYLFL